jgi:hypothetical protein
MLIEINYGSQNVLGVLTWVGGYWYFTTILIPSTNTLPSIFILIFNLNGSFINPTGIFLKIEGKYKLMYYRRGL